MVEDECVVARDIQKMLRRMGYDSPVIALSGEEALQKAEEMCPDIILMDVKLRKEMDGIETAKRIRVRFNSQVIYISASMDEKTVRQAKDSEVFYFLSKPIQEGDLQDIIEKAYSESQTEMKIRRKAGS